MPHASKVRAAEHPGAQQLLHKETCYTESLSLVPLEGQGVKAIRQHVRAVGTESQEDKFGWASPEALLKSAPLAAQAQREAEGNTGFS